MEDRNVENYLKLINSHNPNAGSAHADLFAPSLRAVAGKKPVNQPTVPLHKLGM